MESPERAITQPLAAIDVDGSNDLFFKCPIGGFASLSPGVCPKCSEQLVAVSAVNGSTDARIAVGDGNENERRNVEAS